MAGCERVAEPAAPTLPGSETLPPRALPGTYQLGPDNLLLDDPGPETPVVWIDLEVVGGKVTCHPWRPDEQEISCEVAVWAGQQLRLDLVRKFHHEREDLVERWYFRGTVSDLDAEKRELLGTLVIEPDPAIRPPLNFRVRSPRVALDEDAMAALTETWTRASEARSRAELVAPGKPEETTPSPYGAAKDEPAPVEPPPVEEQQTR